MFMRMHSIDRQLNHRGATSSTARDPTRAVCARIAQSHWGCVGQRSTVGLYSRIASCSQLLSAPSSAFTTSRCVLGVQIQRQLTTWCIVSIASSGQAPPTSCFTPQRRGEAESEEGERGAGRGYRGEALPVRKGCKLNFARVVLHHVCEVLLELADLMLLELLPLGQRQSLVHLRLHVVQLG